MKKQLIVLASLLLLVVGLAALNYQLAHAHRWSSWHWDKKTIKVKMWNCGADTEAARNDWDHKKVRKAWPGNEFTKVMDR